MLKLAALLVFGNLISLEFFLGEIHPLDFVFAFLVLSVVRPFAIWIALLDSSLNWREWIAAAWFGPKGFASVVYGLLILKSSIERVDYLFHLVAIVVALSIIAHSSTDVLIARWFMEEEKTT